MQPGYKTPAFWLTLLATVGTALFASGAAPESGHLVQGASAIVGALAAAGYASVRAFAKGHDGKAAYRTTEFWMAVAAVAVGALLTSGVFPSDGLGLKALGAVASLLAGLGYAARFSLPPVGK